jgi:hypothetical protein
MKYIYFAFYILILNGCSESTEVINRQLIYNKTGKTLQLSIHTSHPLKTKIYTLNTNEHYMSEFRTWELVFPNFRGTGSAVMDSVVVNIPELNKRKTYYTSCTSSILSESQRLLCIATDRNLFDEQVYTKRLDSVQKTQYWEYNLELNDFSSAKK